MIRSLSRLVLVMALAVIVACAGPAAAPATPTPTETAHTALAASLAAAGSPTPSPLLVVPSLRAITPPSPAVEAPAPSHSAAPPSRSFAMNLYRRGDFVSQKRSDWCVPAAVQTMINLFGRRPARAAAVPGQARLDRLARSLSSDRLVGAGSEPEGWAGALNTLGYGPYVVRALRSREAALRAAARAMRQTARPVGLLMWRGAHAWVMSGFEATADPATTDDFKVTHVRISDPWYPRTSAIWGPGQPPNTRLSVETLRADFLPWRRPTVRYVEKDGRFVVVLPATSGGS